MPTKLHPKRSPSFRRTIPRTTTLAQATTPNRVQDILFRYRVLPAPRLEYVGPAVFDLLGYQPDEFYHEPGLLNQIFHPEDRLLIAQLIQEPTSDPPYYLRFVHKNGQTVWFQVHSFAERSTTGSILVVQGVAREITADNGQHQMLESLRRSEARFKRVFEDAVVGILQSSPEGKILNVNPTLVGMFGYGSLKELLQQDFSKMLLAYPEQHQSLIRRLLRPPYSVRAEVRFKRKNGTSFPGMLHLWAVRPTPDEPFYLEGFVEDITERKSAEDALRESEKKLRNVIEQSSEGIVLTNEEGLVIEWNQSMTAITGVPAEKVLGKPVWDVQYRLNLGKVPPREIFDPLRGMLHITTLPGTKGSLFQPYTIEYTRPDGAVRFLEGISYPIHTDRGNMIGIVLRDVTERKLVEQSEREQRILAEALLATAEALTSSVGLEMVLDCILENLERVVPHDAANIMLVENGVARLVRWHKYEKYIQNSEQVFKRSFPIHEMGNFRSAAQLHHPLVIDDTRTWPGWQELGTTGWIRSNIIVPVEMEKRLLGFINLDSATPHFFTPTHVEHLQMFAYQVAIALNNAQLFNDLSQSHTELSQAYDATIKGWALALDLRDHETQGHTSRVARWTLKLARAVGVPAAEWDHIRRGAILHDIGKMGIPDQILLKPEALTPEEMEIMREHPALARRMLEDIFYLKPALDIPYCHHEKWDGSGYPRGLRGAAIPLSARIFAIVDVWDALTTDRVYRKAWTHEQAIDYLREQRGKHFDPFLLDIFLAILREGQAAAEEEQPGESW